MGQGQTLFPYSLPPSDIRHCSPNPTLAPPSIPFKIQAPDLEVDFLPFDIAL